MVAHYFTSAWHHFRRHKGTTLINVFCLTFGLVAFLLAWGRVEYQKHADRQHALGDRTVVVTRYQSVSRVAFHLTPAILRDQLRADFPSLGPAARALYPQEAALTVADKSHFASITYADPDYLQIFDLPFLSGDARKALDQPRSVIVGEQLALRLFGSTNVVGKTVRISGRNDAAAITGVVRSPARPSHIAIGPATMSGMEFSFEAMFSMDMNPSDLTIPRWENDAYFTYVVLPRAGAETLSRFDADLKDFTTRRVPSDLQDQMIFGARPVSEYAVIVMDAAVRAAVTGVSSQTVIKLLGALVLVIACLNYANLATALALSRSKEVALRKVVGASRRQLIVQHLFEGGLLSVASLLLAIIATLLVVRGFGTDTFAATISLFGPLGSFWLMLTTAIVAVSIVASAYPAVALTRVRPAQALRGGKTPGGPRLLATALVGMQFAASSFLLIAAFVLYTHHRDTRAAIWNAEDDPMLAIFNDVRGAGVDLELLKTELERTPGVKAASALHRLPWTIGSDGDALALTSDAGAAVTYVHQTFVAPDFFETMQIELLAGRNFDVGRAADVANIKAWRDYDPGLSSEFNIVVDTALLATLGAPTAAAAIDRIVYRPTSSDGSKPPQRVRIIGVVAQSAFMPLTGGTAGIFVLSPEAAVVPVARISKSDVPATLAAIDQLWHRLAPEVPLKRRFADEQFDIGFEAFTRINQSLAMLALLASAIAVVGLIGMALQVTSRRLHEVGIRKSLGASVVQILWLLLRSFLKPVVIANLLMWPLVYSVMSLYLSMFSSRTPLTLQPFLGSLVVSVVIACTAVGAQTIRAARLRPAEVLRSE
jgi:putative ABC transport system permease protein